MLALLFDLDTPRRDHLRERIAEITAATAVDASFRTIKDRLSEAVRFDPCGARRHLHRITMDAVMQLADRHGEDAAGALERRLEAATLRDLLDDAAAANFQRVMVE